MTHVQHNFGVWFYAASLIFVFTALAGLRWCWKRVRNNEESIPAWRNISFLVGLLLIWIAIVSPAAELDHHSLTAHMVQHLLLMTFAPPLLWLGTPARAITKSLSFSFGLAWMQRMKDSPSPVVFCWLVAAATLIIWHVPAAFLLSLRSGLWHAIEQASFLVAGLLFWLPVIRPLPPVSNRTEWSMLVYLFLATLPCDILSGFLVFCDRVVYDFYSSSSCLLGLSALEDQQCAGALMWTCVTIVYLVAGAILAARLLSPKRVKNCPQSHSSRSPIVTSWTQETA